MNKRNTTGHKQILAEISKTRKVFSELEDFFLKTDEDIANDKDDPRDGIGRFPSLDRLMFLVPCVINHLKGDLSKNKEVEDGALITEGLQAIKEGINSALAYYLRDDVGGALKLLSNALSNIDKLSGTKQQPDIRFLRDIIGIVPDFQILFNTLEGFLKSSGYRLRL